MASLQEPLLMAEKGNIKEQTRKEITRRRSARKMSSSLLRKKSEIRLISKVRWALLRNFLGNLQEVILGTKLSVLFPAIPLPFIADCYGFGRPSIFASSLLGLIPLAERISFVTEQIAYHTGPTVGGLLNATCLNATEIIIAIFALNSNKIAVVKYSLLGSILSNLLLVLGTPLLSGGIANITRPQNCDRRQAGVNSLMLLLALLCHMPPMLFRYATSSTALAADPSLQFSRASSIVMLIAYFAYLVFQLWTHRQLFEAQDEDNNDDSVSEEKVMGLWSGISWLAGMTVFIVLLSEYVVETIEDASDSWGLSVSFLSIILLPTVGNAAEHAGAIIFAFKNNRDISLGFALGSATQISLFVVPLCVIISWIMGNKMDLNFNPVETVILALAIIATAWLHFTGWNISLHGRFYPPALLRRYRGVLFVTENTIQPSSSPPHGADDPATNAILKA